MAKLEEFPDIPPSEFRLYTHQLSSFLLGITFNDFLFLLDMGLGKTLLSIMIIMYRKNLSQVDKTLVVVPNAANIEGWKDEISKFSDLTSVGLIGTREQRFKLLEEEADVYIINYAGLQTLMTVDAEIGSKKKTKTGKKKIKRAVDEELADNFANMFDLAVFDEIHKAKKHDTLTFKLCNRISANCDYRYGLTGTAFGRNPIDLWSQFYLIDRGDTLGNTISVFREIFFNMNKRHVYVKGKKRNFIEWNFDKRLKFKLNRMIQNRSIRYKDSECVDLPKKVKTIIPLNIPDGTTDYYKTMLSSFREAGRQGSSRQNTESSFIKLRQVCSGFLKWKDPETGEMLDITFPENPKIEALRELLLQLPDEKKMVIFHEFNYSADVIISLLKELKIGYATLSGRVTAKEKPKQLRKFIDNPKCRVFVINSASGNAGLNLQIANYCVYYESPVCPIIRKQSEKRVHRIGQNERVYYYDLAMKGSVEFRILQLLEEGKNLFDEVVEGKLLDF